MAEETWRDAKPVRPKVKNEGPQRSRYPTGRPRRVSELDETPNEFSSNADELPFAPLMTMGEVEERLRRADDELLALTESHMGISEQSAEAKADWMAHLSRVLVRIAHSGEKGASDTREAMARTEIDPITGREGNDLYRTYKVLSETTEAQARAMRAIEARIGAWQTICANLRSVAT